MIKYKMDILAELDSCGWTHKRIKAGKILSEATIHSLRHGGMISLASLNNICLMLRCQPGELLEEVPEDAEKIRFF